MKSRRQLSHEEHEIWGHVTKSVKRLKPLARRVVAATGETTEPLPPPPPPGKLVKAAKKKAPAASAATPPKAAHKPLVPLEPKVRRKLGRGKAEVDGRIDLHGLRQDEAHTALVRFVMDAHARDARLVLVITGKGKASLKSQFDGPTGEREVGVLRRVVPHWLGEPSLRHVVLGYESASLRHGGEGAMYVRLRKRPGTEPPQ